MEEHVEIAGLRGTLRGMRHSGLGTAAVGSVVVLHGYFSSNRVGPARLYVHLARALAVAGWRAYRFDFTGVGDSDGDFASTTWESELDDAVRICRFVVDADGPGRIVMLGHSTGANVAVCAATRCCGVDRLLLLSPNVAPDAGMDRLFSAGQLRELRTRGHTVRKGLAISASVVEAIRSKAAVEAAKSVAVPSTVLHGDRDELYPLEGAVELTQALCHGDLRVIEGGDHNFLDQASRDKLTREVLAALSLEHHATLL